LPILPPPYQPINDILPMKKILFLFLSFIIFYSAKAQTQGTDIPDLDKIDIKEPAGVKNTSEKTYSAVDQNPQFPGGIEEFYNFMKTNLRYPSIAKQKEIQGKVFVSFVVDRDGSLTDVKVVKSLSRETDAEAIRLIQSSPKWNPGVQNGKPVRIKYTAPVIFSLQD
jgi:protein TonB